MIFRVYSIEMIMCNGKQSYDSERAAKRVRNIREKDVSRLRVYQCDDCFRFHLTKSFNRFNRLDKEEKEHELHNIQD